VLAGGTANTDFLRLPFHIKARNCIKDALKDFAQRDTCFCRALTTWRSAQRIHFQNSCSSPFAMWYASAQTQTRRDSFTYLTAKELSFGRGGGTLTFVRLLNSNDRLNLSPTRCSHALIIEERGKTIGKI
jgi:hypothetical protein